MKSPAVLRDSNSFSFSERKWVLACWLDRDRDDDDDDDDETNAWPTLRWFWSSIIMMMINDHDRGRGDDETYAWDDPPCDDSGQANQGGEKFQSSTHPGVGCSEIMMVMMMMTMTMMRGDGDYKVHVKVIMIMISTNLPAFSQYPVCWLEMFLIHVTGIWTFER